MPQTVTTCDFCEAHIYYGMPYVCVQRNIEKVERQISTKKDRVNIINSEALITLCAACGNQFSPEVIIKIIMSAD